MEGSSEQIARPRVVTKDLPLKVYTDRGEWHRLHPNTLKTSCGEPVNYYQLRSEPLRHIEHPLANCQCWTDDERREADSAYQSQYGRAFGEKEL